jgi:hypothetical protein
VVACDNFKTECVEWEEDHDFPPCKPTALLAVSNRDLIFEGTALTVGRTEPTEALEFGKMFLVG